MTSARIRSAVAADLPAIEKLILSESMPPFDYQRFVDTFWVLESAGEVVGCIGLELYGTSALLRSIVVGPEMRGTGAGGALTLHLLSEARSRGAKTVYLFTMDKAPFFSRYGFEPITLDDFDQGARNCTQYIAVRNAPPAVDQMLTRMRLSL